MKTHKERIKNESNWWEWITDKVRICTRRAESSIWFYLQDRSMLYRTKEYSRDVRNCWVGSKCPLSCWLSYWRAEPKWGNFQTADLSEYLRRCMWDDPLYSVHASFASNYRTYKECWSDFDFWAFFTNYKMFFILNSVKISLLNPFNS